MNKYGLTELDYYIIVVCRGDESKLPRCSYVNPYTGEKCNEPKKFRSLAPGKFQRTGVRMGIFHDGCSKHTSNAAAQVAQKDNYKKGVTGLQKADRRSKVWREKLSKHAKKQMEEGRSIFSPPEIRDPNIKFSSVNVTPSVEVYKKLILELGFPEDTMLSLEEMFLVDKQMYLNKGKPDDICEYYIATLKEDSTIFKVGVTTDTESRLKAGYRGLSYDSTEVLFKSTRENIADLEYKVKIKFKDSIKLGNEAFDISIKDEMLNYIKELIEEY